MKCNDVLDGGRVEFANKLNDISMPNRGVGNAIENPYMIISACLFSVVSGPNSLVCVTIN